MDGDTARFSFMHILLIVFAKEEYHALMNLSVDSSWVIDEPTDLVSDTRNGRSIRFFSARATFDINTDGLEYGGDDE